MKKALLILVFLKCGLGQPHKAMRIVLLDTILSCPSDAIVKNVFETDWRTMVNLTASLLNGQKETNSDLLSKGFTAFPIAEDEMMIAPTNMKGRALSKEQVPFCNYKLSASYEKGMDSKPHTLEISGDDWSLNPYEVFAHADQFEFSSGVFSNSSRVFLVARKGRVAIQFICKPTGLVFYRALYYPESGK
jgi:hypothetical protein